MPRVPPEIKAEFPLEVRIKIRTLQIDLERFRLNKIRNLAVIAKESNQTETSKLYYKAWAARMGNLKKIQKQEREEQNFLVKETKKLTTSKKLKLKVNANANANVTSVSTNELGQQLC